MNWIPHKPETWPYRYGETNIELNFSRYLGRWENGRPLMAERIVPAGTTVKIVMVSRFGDVGITDDLNEERNYQSRVLLENLDNLREKV